MKLASSKIPLSLAFFLGIVAVFSACSRSEMHTTDNGLKASPAIPLSTSTETDLSTIHLGSKKYFAVEATLSDQSFSRLTALLKQKSRSEKDTSIEREFKTIFKTLQSIDATYFSLNEEFGYFTFYLPYPAQLPEAQSTAHTTSHQVQEWMAPLKKLKFNHHLIFNPIIVDPTLLSQIKALSPQAEGLIPLNASSRGGSQNFSGLTRIHAPEFVRLAEKEIGNNAKVNGDTVNLGITDTGITLNHPTFLSTDRTRNRIAYMRDFTREGRVYFNLNTKFKAEALPGSDDSVVVSAEIIVTPPLPGFPAGDQFYDIKELEIKVSQELRALLIDPKTSAKLGILAEKSFASENEKIDLNGNGSTQDEIPIILFPGKTAAEDVLYVDISGNGDFRNVRGVTSWNQSKATVTTMAEQIGFDIQEDKLPSSDGKREIPLHSVSIVGFDPGNHGTHVAGIAAGSRTIANDDPSTLARGVAPDAQILMNRICANNGGCNATQAMIDLVTRGGANVVNMSIGGLDAFNDGFSVQDTIINRLSLLKNVLFIVSAGNSGPGKQTVGSPSTARLALSVGASASYGLIQRQYQWPGSKLIRTPEDDEDFMLFFSGRGPTAAGGFKPNLVAPGTELSAIRLNSAPGDRSGMDVYWGTSMSAPTVTGAYALFLDAINKYNTEHPHQPLPKQATLLRAVLMESARPFDVSRYNPETGQKSQGQYTWIDQGTGMLDLVAAWKKLIEIRDHTLPTAVQLRGAPVDLDYQVMIPQTSPHGNLYDGSTPSDADPTFGTGLYLDYYRTESLLPVYVARQLPFGLNRLPEIGSLLRDLETTADEFVIKTVIHGSDQEWLKAGVLDQLSGDNEPWTSCDQMESSHLTLLGRGVDVHTDENGSSTLSPFPASVLNICLNRDIIRHQLPPGDHGALISAYRIVNGNVSSIPSFWIPVYLQVPHQTLSGSNAYTIQSTVKSFGLSRNYLNIPKGTSLVQLTVEVPPLKLDSNGLPLPGEKCSGVELMALMGNNTEALLPNRKSARISNCNPQGRPVLESERRRVVVTKVNPREGTWDLHIFGQYKYPYSKYQLRMDYLTSNTNTQEITGQIASLTGSLNWTIQESSLSVIPDYSKSNYLLNALSASIVLKIAQEQIVVIPNPQGEIRSYPADTKSVTITTGGSPGNDIDLSVLECPPTLSEASRPQNCQEAGRSGGASDEETVTFTPKPEKVYLAAVRGYDIKENGSFSSTEEIEFAPEYGSVSIEGIGPIFQIKYGFTEAQLAGSHLASSQLFASGKYQLRGSLNLRSSSDLPLFSVPVRVTH